MDAPLILTLQLDDAALATLDALRRAHFPPARNFIPAHITLFHALPASEEPAIRRALATAASETPRLAIRLPAPRFMGRGVLLTVEAPALVALRRRLAAAWEAWLNAQDRQGYRPHVTIQNKVAPDVARQLFADLSASWAPLEARGEGLLLWRYLGGPWEQIGDFPFQGGQ
jgi:2'-5' RNA ligase